MSISTTTTAMSVPTSAPVVAAPSTAVGEIQATALGGGELFSGMTFVITMQMLYHYGWKCGITNDKQRQILLNLICFVCSINTMISYGFNATRQSIFISNVTTCITFLSVQFGLVILNHNSIIRVGTIVSDNFSQHRKMVDNACKFLYLLPWVVLIPIYYAIDEKWTQGGLKSAFNTSLFNANYYKPLNIALIISTELLAILTDIFLLRKVLDSQRRVSQTAANNKTPMRKQMSPDILAYYAMTWFIILFDVVIKILISAGVSILFDSIVSIFTIALRSRANLIFGLELQHIFRTGGTVNTGGSGHGSNQASKGMSTAPPVSMKNSVISHTAEA